MSADSSFQNPENIQKIEGERKFNNCRHKEWKKLTMMVGCCPDQRKLEEKEGFYCDARKIMGVSGEICFDCWKFEEKRC